MPPGSVPALSLQSSEDDTIEVWDHGPHYTTNWVRVQVHQADNHVQCWSEVRVGPGWSPHSGPQDDQGGPRTQTHIWGSPGLFLQSVLSPMTKEPRPTLLPPATWESEKSLLTYL